jgi:hypothetical protein
MPGARIWFGCLLLVVVGCTTGARVQTPQGDPEIGRLTEKQAVVQMKRPPDYRYEGDEGIVTAWIDHWTETKFLPLSCIGRPYIEIPHGQHTHLVFDRKTKLLAQKAIKQW